MEDLKGKKGAVILFNVPSVVGWFLEIKRRNGRRLKA